MSPSTDDETVPTSPFLPFFPSFPSRPFSQCYDVARHEGHLKKRSGRRDDDDDGRHHHHHLADGAGKGVEDSPFGGGFGTESSELVVKADFFFGKSPTKSTASVSSSSPSLSASSHDDGAIAPPPSRPVKTVKKSKKYTDDTFLLAAAAMMNHHKDFNEQDKHWGSPDETFPLEPLQDDGSSEGMALAELYSESSFDDDNDDY